MQEAYCGLTTSCNQIYPDETVMTFQIASQLKQGHDRFITAENQI